jgi:hypothetical protein
MHDNLQSVQDNMQTMDDLLNGKITDVAARLPMEEYDCIIYRVWNYGVNVSDYLAKDGKTGLVVLNSTDAAYVFNQALLRYNTIYVKASDYNLTSDVVMADKKNACVDSDGATLYMYGHRFWVNGESFETSQRNQLSGLIIVNGTVRVENSFHTTVTNMIFQNCTAGVELINTNTWTEVPFLTQYISINDVQVLFFELTPAT